MTQQPGYVIWKRASADDQTPTTRKQGENTMATDASTALRTLARHPEIEEEDSKYLEAAARRLERQRGESPENPEDELLGKLEKVQRIRDTVAKGQVAGPGLRAAAQTPTREVELAYLKKHSGYWAGESAQLAQEVRKRESGLDRIA